LPKYIIYALFFFYKFINKNLILFEDNKKDISNIKHINNVIGLLYAHLQLKFKSILQNVSEFKSAIMQNIIYVL
jgi:hypothetical protein